MESARIAGDNGGVTSGKKGRGRALIAGLLLVAYVAALWGGGAYFTRRAQNGDRELPVYVRGGERLAAGAEIYRRGTEDKPFTYPPFAAVPFVPFAWLPADYQPAMWFAVNFHLALLIVWILHRWSRRPVAEGQGQPGIWSFWLLTILLGGHHVLSVFSNQSHDLLIAAALALAVGSWARAPSLRSGLLAGFWIGVGAAIKATPLLFLGLFGARFRFAPVAALLGAFVVLSLLPDWVFPRADGNSWIVAWFDINLRGLEVGGTASAAGAWNAHSFLNQGMSGSLTRLFSEAAILGPFVDESAMIADLGATGCKVVTLTCQVGVLLALVLSARHGARAVRTAADPDLAQRTVAMGEVGAFACGMVLLSPQSSKAHFCVWVFAAAFVVDRLLRGRRDLLLIGLTVLAFAVGPMMSKGIVGRELGNLMLARGNVTWCTLLLLLATLRGLWQPRPATRIAPDPAVLPR